MPTPTNFQSYENLFEKLNLKKGKEGRSVYSPAAYLSDLLQLLEDRFGESNNFFSRRSDVKDIKLNGENAFTQIAYLDIVNRILEHKISEKSGEDASDVLKSVKFPFHLPFHLEAEQFKKYLHFLGAEEHQLYRLFSQDPDNGQIARSYLQISQEALDSILQLPSDPKDFFLAHFGLQGDYVEKLSNLESFLTITSLSRSELNELLFQNLSRTAVRGEQTELSLANESFLNRGTTQLVLLDNSETTILWWNNLPEIKGDQEESIVIPKTFSAEAFLRLQRSSQLIRLAHQTGLSITDAELILRSLCGNTLDQKAIEKIALIKFLQDKYDLPVEECCALITGLNARGIGDQENPKDLFNRTFNNNFTDFDSKYIPGSAFIPASFRMLDPYQLQTDLLAMDNQVLLQRIAKALHLSVKGLTAIIQQFRDHFGPERAGENILREGNTDLPAMLAVLYRINRLTDLLDISAPELFHLFDILEKDPSIRRFSQFSALIFEPIAVENAYQIIQEKGQDPIKSNVWLIQTLIGLTSWMQESDFTAEELKQILTGKGLTEREDQQRLQEKLDFLNQLYQQVSQVFFTDNHFQSGQFDKRDSRSIYRTICQPELGLVSSRDKRLIHFEEESAQTSANRAIEEIDTIHRDDFRGLNLADKMVDKVFNNLIIKGYIQPDGSLNEEVFPQKPEAFHINSSSTVEQEQLFETIHNLVRGNNGEETTTLVEDGSEIALYPSDLEELEIQESRRSELYDNLIFNGYIDEEGHLLQPTFFFDKANTQNFKPNANIDHYSPRVYELIKTKIDCYHSEPLTLSPDDFIDLPLAEVERNDLLENLRFNDYLDEENAVLDKEALLDLNPNELNITIQFYPLRKEILATLQAKLAKFKAQYFTVQKEMLSETADQIVADILFHYLQNNYLKDYRIEEQGKAFFREADNLDNFTVDPYFTDLQHQSIFKFMQGLVERFDELELQPSDLADLDLEEEHQEEILNLLHERGYLQDQKIANEKRSYFLNVNNELEFNLEGYTDFNRDIFYLLHQMSKSAEEKFQEIVDSIQMAAEDQHTTLLSALAEFVELPEESTEVLLGHFFKNMANPVERLLTPLLATVDNKGRNQHLPADNTFNIFLQRLQQSALLISKLDLSGPDTDVVFSEQNLVEKFPEKLHLPAELDRFDALLETMEKIYVFRKNRYWTYSNTGYELLESGLELSQLSPELAGLSQVDAAFVDPSGKPWIIGRTLTFGEEESNTMAAYFYKDPQNGQWTSIEKAVGLIDSNFNDPERIDASFIDAEGKIYLFSGDQYVRYSGNMLPDEGYPKNIEDNWHKELNFKLPPTFYESIDASLTNTEGLTYLFKDNEFISSDDYLSAKPIKEFWGKIRNNFNDADRLDAAFYHQDRLFLFSGEQTIAYGDSIENDVVYGQTGSLEKLVTSIPGLPPTFTTGIDAVLAGADGQNYVFKDKQFVKLNVELEQEGEGEAVQAVRDQWGRIKNNLQASGRLDAAMAGLDGRTYLFCGDQYYRYSRADFSLTDEGYPRSTKDWGGLTGVDAAFVLDGKTYLFGKNADQKATYVCYSSNDYSQPDEGYPTPVNDNWWNLPQHLLYFNAPDAVFVGNDDHTYLFQGSKFVAYDQQHRWWTEAQPIRQRWDSLPFERIAAAFTGKDGRTYIFEEQQSEVARGAGKRKALQFVRYTDPLYNKIDDRFPKNITDFWGKIMNNIQKTGTIDAAVRLTSTVFVDPENEEQGQEQKVHTYLFSGNQFFRYTGNNYDVVDEGYPKTIKSSLQQEPRFRNLDSELSQGIDAIFADQRNVYLFQGNQWKVISEERSKTYEQLLKKPAKSVFVDRGHIYAQIEERWHRLSAIENETFVSVAETPACLREVPDDFQTGSSTILKGLDKNTYIFKQVQHETDEPQVRCYNVSLGKHYPLGEEWGKTKNHFQTENTIDAAFTGEDGKVYVFSGDQFISYQLEKEKSRIPAFMDSNPKPISQHWGGLQNVQVAFVRDDKTYLLEAPNEEGVFRYHCYSDADYSQPDTPEPMQGDWTWWEMPDEYLEQGFKEVQAVLFDGDNMLLLDEHSFVQYDHSEQIWTYPKPLDRIWGNLPLENDKFSFIKTAFTGPDNVTRFFSEHYYVEYNNRIQKIGNTVHWTLHPIKNRWGLGDNNFTRNELIHAAVVIDQKYTFLFAGDQYVRYTGADYQYVDEGYPKDIIGHLRQEPGFKGLTEAQEKMVSFGEILGGIIANQRNTYIFEQQNCHVLSRQLSQSYPLNHLGQIRNNIARLNKVDAAYVNQHGDTYLFADDQYFKYNSSDYRFIDEGYPKSISRELAAEIGLDLPKSFLPDRIDAIFRGPEEQVYLFRDKNFITAGNSDVIQSIQAVWSIPENPFSHEDNHNNPLIDAAFTSPMGHTYFFKGNQYVRYSDLEQEFADEGYPKRIKDNWGNLFPGSRNGQGLDRDFEAQIDTAFTLQGHTYFAKGDEYVKYTNSDYRKMDAISPQPFNRQWADRNDFLLHDLKLISRYQQLKQQYEQVDFSLTDFFYDGQAYLKTPFQFLAQLFDWNADEIKWLKQRQSFLRKESDMEVHLDLEQVIAMYDLFELSQKFALPPSSLYQEVWVEKYRNQNIAKAANVLYKQLGLINGKKEWEILSRQIHDEMNLLRRDALLPYLIHQIDSVKDARDLFEYLLIDVEMGSDAKTSDIKEATAAAQLYFHRYFVNLEELNDTDTEKKLELKSWWKWMKNYRVWEANRKVFLYPENYIRPELRDTKTGEFKKLEEGLMQGIIDRESVERNFKQYLDTFATVGNLKIAGANIYEDGEEDVLMLFGYTRSEPATYYYRLARFAEGAIEWGAWKKTELPIKSERVFPVYANGRLLVFWVEIEDYEDSKGTLNRKTDKSEFLEVNTNNTSIKHRAHVLYSYIDLNGRWSPPQQLKRNIELSYKLDAAYMEPIGENEHDLRIFSGTYCSTSNKRIPGGEIKRIEEYPEYDNLPDDFKTGIDSVTIFKEKRYFFKGSDVVIQNVEGNTLLNPDKPIISITELIKQPESDGAPQIVMFSMNHLGIGHIAIRNDEEEDVKYEIPEYFDAAFSIEGQILCLIDPQGNYTFFDANEKGDRLTPIQTMDTIHQKFDVLDFNFEFFMSTIANKGGQFAPADGVFHENNNYFVLRNGLYECYGLDDKGLLKAKEGFPKAIRGNLSFNMDNFFNQLHMVYDTNEEYTSVNYTTPKGDLLLSGKLHANFTFEEVEFRNNVELDLLNNWAKFLEWFESLDVNQEIHQEAEAATATLLTEMRSLQTKVNTLDQIKQGINTLIPGLKKFDVNDMEGFIHDLNQASGQFTKITSKDSQALKDLKKNTKDLIDLFVQWKDSDREERQELTGKVSDAAKNLSGDLTSTVKTTMNSKIETLEGNISTQATTFLNGTAPSRNYQQHLNFYNQFNWIGWVLVSLQNSLKLESAIFDHNAYQQHGAEQATKNNEFNDHYPKIRSALEEAINTNTSTKTGLSTLHAKLTNVVTHAGNYQTSLEGSEESEGLRQKQSSLKSELDSVSDKFTEKILDERERIFGRFDLFHKDTDFGIETSTNFSFGKKTDWYIFEAKNGSFLCRPLGETEKGAYEIIRLTTNTIPALNQRLFVKGIEGLLALKTQKEQERPGFGNQEKDIAYNTERKPKIKVPVSSNLDFQGANSTYYWEIFFHAPFLIAQTLNTKQKFAEAKAWYEFIFDPTNRENVWRFLPFADDDLERAFISDPNQLRKYYNDPFDPHAIAGLRINAYRKTIVMNYIDNLLDWGDMLFRQYTMESINEARMLYILAYDLLGKRPESTGDRILTTDQTYAEQKQLDSIDLEIWDLENESEDEGQTDGEERPEGEGQPKPQTPAILTIHASNLSSYFFIPENDLFLEYWDRVEDRLYKIRHSLNIKGLKQPLPLFQPPIDPAALVLAAGTGAGIAQAMGSIQVAVPHYRFSFLINKAKELIDKLNQFGSELLNTLEKKDAEELSRLQSRQEGIILKMSQGLRESQLQEADNSLKSLNQSLEDANWRLNYHLGTIEADYLGAEKTQMGLMGGAVAGHTVATIFNTLSVIAYPWPKTTIGPFSFGTTIDPGNIGEGLSKVGEAASSLSEGLSIGGEIAGLVAQHERMEEDWALQKATTEHEIKQIELEIQGAEIQKKMAQLELALYEKEVEQQASIQTYYREKWSNQELYQWMAGKLSGLYFQTYKMAHDMAKYAEKAFQFERGVKTSEVNFVNGTFWDSQRKGLLAGESLGLALNQMEKAYIESNERRLEISKNISLVELDPIAYLELLRKGSCEFRLSEALFDYDFQGHYCRQIKTISLTIDAGEGKTVHATLTQLNNRTVMAPDPKAVKYLLDPKDQQPLSIRSNWKANQQIAISHVGEYEESNGLFELRFDDERYLPFEGTGAVSTWRLELSGRRGSYQLNDIKSVTINVKYTALQGGEAFADSVRGLLKPYPTAHLIDVANTFPEEWQSFLISEDAKLTLPFQREHFPNMSSSKLSGILPKFQLNQEGAVKMLLNGDDSLVLQDGKYLETPGLAIRSKGSNVTFELKGKKDLLENLFLAIGYKAQV